VPQKPGEETQLSHLSCGQGGWQTKKATRHDENTKMKKKQRQTHSTRKDGQGRVVAKELTQKTQVRLKKEWTVPTGRQKRGEKRKDGAPKANASSCFDSRTRSCEKRDPGGTTVAAKKKFTIEETRQGPIKLEPQ